MSKGDNSEKNSGNGNGQHPTSPDHDANGKFKAGNSFRMQPGSTLNPKGRPKNTYGDQSRKLDKTPVRELKWARELYVKLLGGTQNEIPEAYTVGELMLHSDRLNRARGKVGYLVEDNNRKFGKVPDRIEQTGVEPVTVALFSSQPPPGWYDRMRSVVGSEDGDPALPGETGDGGTVDK